VFAGALQSLPSYAKLSIPTVVFVELFDKWCLTEESTRLVYYEVYRRLADSPNVEIRPLDREVLELMVRIGGSLESHEMHDKVILASAIALSCPLITCDVKIVEYNRRHRVIPSIVY
jgi:predicted nucleic acid-binding protein